MITAHLLQIFKGRTAAARTQNFPSHKDLANGQDVRLYLVSGMCVRMKISRS
jgi:hypothetical protein